MLAKSVPTWLTYFNILSWFFFISAQKILQGQVSPFPPSSYQHLVLKLLLPYINTLLLSVRALIQQGMDAADTYSLGSTELLYIQKMRSVHMDIGNQISSVCNESECVNRYWNLVCLMVEAMSSVISTQNYNIAASLISLLSKVNLNSKRVLATKWLCREQSKSLIKQLNNGKKKKKKERSWGKKRHLEVIYPLFFVLKVHFLSFSAYFSKKKKKKFSLGKMVLQSTLSWKGRSTESGGTRLSQFTPTAWKKKICCGIQLFLPLLLTEIQVVSCSSLEQETVYQTCTCKLPEKSSHFVEHEFYVAISWMPWETMN